MIDYAATFADSLARVTAPDMDERFFDRFYERFTGLHPEIKEKFSKTDFAHQKKMLRESLDEMRDFADKLCSNNYIITLARIHGTRGHDIAERFFDLWLDELVETVAEIDPECNDNVRLAWRVTMAPGIEFMKFFHSRP